MSRRITWRWLAPCCLATLVLSVAVLGRFSGRLPPMAVPEPELHLPAEAPVGSWSDPAEGAREEEEQILAGAVLSGRALTGPIRCRLRAICSAGSAGGPDLELAASNTSDAPFALRGSASLLDHATFVFRGPSGEVVGSFCYAAIRSPALLGGEPPSLVLPPGAEQAENIYLSVAAGRGFRPLPPGRYSIEAVLHKPSDRGASGDRLEVLAASARLPVIVGSP